MDGMHETSTAAVSFIDWKFGKRLPIADSFIFHPKDGDRVGSGAKRVDAMQQSQTRRTQTDSLSCVGVLSKPPKPRANNSEQGTCPETQIGSE